MVKIFASYYASVTYQARTIKQIIITRPNEPDTSPKRTTKVLREVFTAPKFGQLIRSNQASDFASPDIRRVGSF